jgi:molybdopterin/thiamine biosynthesis adenylyltransferase
LTGNYEVVRPAPPEIFDRNIRAFGGDVQQVLQDLTIGIVGCGGTGSIIAEQLVRLGVRRFILVDHDELSITNLTRVYGSYAEDVGRPKVEVIADHLLAIAPEADARCLISKVTIEATAQALADADLVFGCTDDNAGRLVLSRLATYLLLPVIDCGVVLTNDENRRLDGIHGRVTVVYPGSACLVCRDRIDLTRAQSEGLRPEEHQHRAEEGYAPGLPGIEPAVVSFTTAVGAQAAGELLERLTWYGPSVVPSEVLLRIHEREVSTNLASPREGHYCHHRSGKLGLGLTEPFLERTWVA